MKLTKIGEFLKRSKIPLDILDDEHYNRVTIRINHNGVSLRDNEIGKKIGTKKQFILKSGQFILSKIDARYGAFGIAPDEVEGSIITGNFWAYDVDKKKVNIEWFNQFTNSPVFYEVCERASSGITHRKYLDEKFFLNYEILLPSVEEQLSQIEKIKEQKISFGELSTELTHQLSLVKKLRQQLLQDAMQGKLTAEFRSSHPELVEGSHHASELLKKIKAEKQKLIAEGKLNKEKKLPDIKADEIPFEIPEGWVWCRLNDICEAIIDCPHSTPHYIDKETGYYGIDTNCINDKGEIIRLRSLSFESYQERIKRLIPQEFDIVYAREGSIGLATFIPANSNICLGQRVMLFRASKAITYHYLKYSVTDFGYKNRLLAKHRGMGAKHVNVKDIVESLVALPPLTEQHHIVQKLDEIMQICDALEASIKESTEQNEKLLQQVLREALQPESILSVI